MAQRYRKKTGPREQKTFTILNNTLMSSTCSVVKGPLYLCLPKSGLEGKEAKITDSKSYYDNTQQSEAT